MKHAGQVHDQPPLPEMPRPAFGGVQFLPGFEPRRASMAGQLSLAMQGEEGRTVADEMAATGAQELFDEEIKEAGSR